MDPKALFLEHFEKGGLALALGTLVLIGVGTVSPPRALCSERLEPGVLRAKVETARAHLSSARHEAVAPPDLLSKVRARLNPAAVPQVSPFPGWVMHRRPALVLWTERTTVPDVVHGAPVRVLSTAPRRDRIAVSWEPSARNAHVAVSRFVIERKEGDGPWLELARPAATQRTHVDATVRARRTYRYRVASVARIDDEDPEVKKHGLTLARTAARRVSAPTVAITTRRRAYAMLLQGRIGQRAALAHHGRKVNLKRYPEIGTADLKVWVWDPARDRFKPTTVYGVREGQPIRSQRRVAGRVVAVETGLTLQRVFLRTIRKTAGSHTYSVDRAAAVVLFPTGGVETLTEGVKPTVE